MGPRKEEAGVAPDEAAVDHAHADPVPVDAYDAQLDPPVAQEDGIAGSRGAHEPGRVRPDPVDITGPVRLIDRPERSVGEGDRLRGQRADADLGSLYIAHDRDLPSEVRPDGAHPREPRAVLCIAPVRKVEAEGVRAGAGQAQEPLRRTAGRADRDQDLGSPHGLRKAMGVQISP